MSLAQTLIVIAIHPTSRRMQTPGVAHEQWRYIFMSNDKRKTNEKPYRVVNLSRLEALGDAIFAFSLTLLALDLRLPETASTALAQGILALLPKLLVFVFAFLVIAQEWDVHQRTMMHISHADGIFVWLYLLSLMFVVLMPASADVLGRYPLQPLALIFSSSIQLYSAWLPGECGSMLQVRANCWMMRSSLL